MCCWNVWGTDNVGKINADGNKFFYIKDHLGSVRVVLNSDNQIVSAIDYDCWGYPLENRSYQSDDINYKFTGKQRDTETGYDYFGARYYDARIGRWGGVEPLLEKYISYSPYQYGLLNPMKLVDVDGKDVIVSFEDAKYLGKLVNLIASTINPDMKDLIVYSISKNTKDICVTYFKTETDLFGATGNHGMETDYAHEKLEGDPLLIYINPGIFNADDKDNEETTTINAILLEHEFNHLQYLRTTGIKTGAEFFKWKTENKDKYKENERKTTQHTLELLKKYYIEGIIKKDKYNDITKKLNDYLDRLD